MDRLQDQEPEVEKMETEESLGFDIKKVERLVQAKEKKEKLETRIMVRNLVQEMVRQVPVKSILEECLARSVWEGEARKVIGEDLELQDEMERRILQARKERRLESNRRQEKEREARLLRKKVSEELWKLIINLEQEVDRVV